MPGPLSTGKQLDGYPQAWGAQFVSIIDHLGPASYTQLTNGTPPTGGDTIGPQEAGMRDIQAVIPVGLSDNGQYVALVTSGLSGRAEASGNATFFISYFVRAGGASWVEVSGATNLSGRTFRFLVIGR
jgi:hypothetical protein